MRARSSLGFEELLQRPSSGFPGLMESANTGKARVLHVWPSGHVSVPSALFSHVDASRECEAIGEAEARLMRAAKATARVESDGIMGPDARTAAQRNA